MRRQLGSDDLGAQRPSINLQRQCGPDQTHRASHRHITLHVSQRRRHAVGSLSFAWTTVTGPATVVLGAYIAEQTAQSMCRNVCPRLTPSDGEFTEATICCTVMAARPQNQTPTANAGADQTYILSGGAQLDGSARTTGSRGISRLLAKINGPGAVTS